MTTSIYLYRKRVIIPTQYKTEAGFYIDMEPVSVFDYSNTTGIVSAIEMAIERGNPIVPTPPRDNFPKPVILKYTTAKSWRSFEKSAIYWSIKFRTPSYHLVPYRRAKTGGFEADQTETQKFSTPTEAASQLAKAILTTPQ